ncbi:hypothetical protein SKAU_G00132910 [Synaphobranchus kaupii]|uniref:Retrotransposon gag domain-containing protein n=1 Tax=Synaphobranchus kaupii TaxID=118154 RepID=A0A9Q1J3N1_SYNKA|nr:hypothetical protein SKAU_G00132910 [Synaphobranchus kaupii]
MGWDCSAQRLLHLCQGSRCAAEFAVEFRTLAVESGWNDMVLQEVFRNGMRDVLRDELAMRDDASSLDNPISLSLFSIQVVNRLWARQREKTGRGTPPDQYSRTNPVAPVHTSVSAPPLVPAAGQGTPISRGAAPKNSSRRLPLLRSSRPRPTHLSCTPKKGRLTSPVQANRGCNATIPTWIGPPTRSKVGALTVTPPACSLPRHPQRAPFLHPNPSYLTCLLSRLCISTLQLQFQELTHSTWPQKHSQSTYLHLQPQKPTHSTLQLWPLKLTRSTQPQKPPCTTHQKLAFLSPALLACFGFLSPVLYCLFIYI